MDFHNISLKRKQKTLEHWLLILILEIKNIDAAYGKFKVLHDVNISVPRGSTVAVVGESGSGKSTTARVVTGLLPQLSGSIEFDGAVLPKRLEDRTKEQKRIIQMIYQMADTAMNPRQTVREIIGRPLEFYLDLKGKEKENKIFQANLGVAYFVIF